MNILVTGASGFVGKAMIRDLMFDDRFDCIGATRSVSNCRALMPNFQWVEMLGIDHASPNFCSALASVDCVVHVAGLAHVRRGKSKRDQFFKVNRDLTLTLARQAADKGVSKFIYLSTIGVNGSSNLKPFHENSLVNPISPYSLSKYQAEIGLNKISKETDLKVTIIRPPLVFGASAPGNFGLLCKAIEKGCILPLAALENNRRTLIGIDNLCGFIKLCILKKEADNQLFLIGEDEDISTADLYRMLVCFSGNTYRGFPLPEKCIRFLGRVTGQNGVVDQLCGSLRISSNKAKTLLTWSPTVSLEEGLERVFLK